MIEKRSLYKLEEQQQIGIFAEDMCLSAIDSLSALTSENSRQLGTLLVDYNLHSLIITRRIHELRTGRDMVYDWINARVMCYQTAINEAMNGDYMEVKLVNSDFASLLLGEKDDPVAQRLSGKVLEVASIINEHDVPYVRTLPHFEDPAILAEFDGDVNF